MQYFIIYVASILVSLGMDFDYALQFAKDVVDAGGKFNVDKIEDIYKCIPELDRRISKFARFIPIFNVAYSISNRLTYETRRNDILMQLNMIGAIDQLTEEEKEEYNKRPTRFNALMTICKTTKKEVNDFEMDAKEDIIKEELLVAKKMDSVPTCEEEYPVNKIVLTIGDSAYEVEGDTIDEQFENVFMYLNTYEKLLNSDEYYSAVEAGLSPEERKQRLVELKVIKKNLLKMKKTINKNEKKLVKQKK